MEIIADLHIHSHYARATSRNMDLASLNRWGKIKGIELMGTGDFTHPLWLAELERDLRPNPNGLFSFKDDTQHALQFVPTVEVSCIYSDRDKVRKVHLLIVAPDFTTIRALNKKLSRYGDLSIDGRPVLALSCRDLVEICLETSEEMFIIPAHVWTPWFGVFGSKSGVDNLEEAFGDLSAHIKAIETGLSSDPQMNWQLPSLQGVSITSHSDAHSPQKLGREATVLELEDPTYAELKAAISTNDMRLKGTIEFFPQEGKYHYDGHRKCGVSLSPQEARAMNSICPVCAKKLTLGVLHRIEDLANTSLPLEAIVDSKKSNSFSNKQVEYIVPLMELIAGSLGLKSSNSKKVMQIYFDLIDKLGNEFFVLRKLNLSHPYLQKYPRLKLALENMRRRELKITPGYDGIFGKVEIYAH